MLWSCLTVTALLLSGCGTAQEPETQPAAETTVAETTVPETTVPETTAAETEAAETAAETEAAETAAADAAADAQAGLGQDHMPDGTPVYLVAMPEYLAAHPDVSPVNAQALNADFSGGGEDTSMACFFFDAPIKNCLYLMAPMYFSFEGTKDPSTIAWGSFFLMGTKEECVKADHGTYLELDPQHVAQAADPFTMGPNNVGIFMMGAAEPMDICAITALPVAAPDSWDPFSVGLAMEYSLIGFPTEADRQVFLDSLAK